jgi:hypothetical protein
MMTFTLSLYAISVSNVGASGRMRDRSHAACTTKRDDEPDGAQGETEIVSKDMPRVTLVLHGKPWAGWPGGVPQSVRDAYDELLAEKGELWPAESTGS